MNSRRATIVLAVMLSLLISLSAGSASSGTDLALGEPCTWGTSYNPACDVDHDGDVDVTDIQLTAGHWGHTGAFVSDGWSLTGNAGTTPGTHFLGTTDNQALEIKVNGQRALRLEPRTTSPNIVGGHSSNGTYSGVYGAVIAGGGGSVIDYNMVTDAYSTIGGGGSNWAGNAAGTVEDAAAATVGGGASNRASGPYSTVPGGFYNTAAGYASFAAGRKAKALHDGSFVLADSSNFDFASTTPNTMRARFTEGIRLVVAIDGSGNYTVSCVLNQSTVTWSCFASDSLLENAAAVDGRDTLDKLAGLPIVAWRAGEDGALHLGPLPDDFKAAFGLGGDDEGISTIDLDGVALASIQRLYALVQEQEARLAGLEERLDALEANTGSAAGVDGKLATRAEAD